jgi:hypothetical protein
MQNASLMISAGLKFNKGNYSGGIIDITTYGLGNAVKFGLTRFGIEGMDHGILNNGFNVIKNNMGNWIANEVNDEIRKK